MGKVIWCVLPISPFPRFAPLLSSRMPGPTSTLTVSFPQLVLVWTPGKGSPIHDHADAHCLMKVLKGTLFEIRFSHPDRQISSVPIAVKETTYKENEVTYMADELGIHKIYNPDPERLAVSLHRKYTPYDPRRHIESCLDTGEAGTRCFSGMY